jgi:hypothetical protein
VTDTKTYDGTTASSGMPSVSGLQPGDSVTGTTQAFQSKNVLGANGSTLEVTGYTVNDGNSGANYTVDASGTAAGTITPAPLSISAVTDTKTYDGTTSSDETPSVSGLQGTDSVTGLAQTFDSANAGSRTLSVSAYTVNDDNSGGNYAVDASGTAAGTIDPRNLTIDGALANDKVYDGTTEATVDFSGASLVGVVGSDGVHLDSSAYSASFADKNVGDDKPVTVTGVDLAGGDAGNYTVSQPSGLMADIDPWNAEGHGFYQPVGVPNSYFVAAPGSAPTPTELTKWNTVKGGSTVPLKFNIYAGTTEMTTLDAIIGFTASRVSCSNGLGVDAVDFVTTGQTTLRYSDGQWIQNWKTPTGTDCYRATAHFADGSTLSAFFKLKK